VATPFRFSEHRPDPRLRQWVLTYWEFVVSEGAPATHHVPPDGCTSVVLSVRGGSPPALLTSGPWTTPLVVPATSGHRTRGIRLAPGAAPSLLDVPAEQLVNRVIPITGQPVLPIAGLITALQATTIEAVAEQCDAQLFRVLDALPAIDPVVARAIQLLWQSGGTMALPLVAEQVGCSPRTLLRHVRHSTGLTPKQFARIVRFHAAARVMAGGDATIGTAAASGGYADQPHFHHEVGSLTGLTPGELADRIRKTDHRHT
jgi:AraC-like DNA-binding protein